MPDRDATYDLVVLGSGTAGVTVAQRCREAGWRVALIENRDFGGTCALRGCEPKKVFWTIAGAVERAQRLAPHGVAGGAALRFDWAAAQRFKQSFTDPVPAQRRESLEAAGIEAIEGQPRFVAPDALEVAGRRLVARRFLIATGAHPAPLSIEGAAQLATSDDFLDFPEMPDSLLFIGGGFIAFECAHLAARAGAKVRILEAAERPLEKFDPDLVDRLVAHGRTLGIELVTGFKAKAIHPEAGGFRVEGATGDSFQAARVLHGLGRVPALDGLQLEAAGVTLEKGHLPLDEFLRVRGNERIFAAGDAAGVGPALTPIATHDAKAVARSLLEGCTPRPEQGPVPSAVFTLPPLAGVGLTEAAAREAGQAYELRQGDMAEFQSVRRMAEPCAAYKLLLEPGSERLLGAHLLGPEAADIISLFGLALRQGMDAAALRAMITAYPTGASNISAMLK
ncbi:NAD(P)/FAD-dependent oxidoreductase [Roseomonas sp. 18066]|uniref:dihydrolipoyl dehydrogenase family protein n=1 Tax=Roseomonas sp. 18066 TaxID=2681412 RepID=UPI00135756F3|nr:NAD(P)/FAD-dependent oxidoreductase [Roseomonas sp. 18066]